MDELEVRSRLVNLEERVTTILQERVAAFEKRLAQHDDQLQNRWEWIRDQRDWLGTLQTRLKTLEATVSKLSVDQLVLQHQQNEEGPSSTLKHQNNMTIREMMIDVQKRLKAIELQWSRFFVTNPPMIADLDSVKVERSGDRMVDVSFEVKPATSETKPHPVDQVRAALKESSGLLGFVRCKSCLRRYAAHPRECTIVDHLEAFASIVESRVALTETETEKLDG